MSHWMIVATNMGHLTVALAEQAHDEGSDDDARILLGLATAMFEAGRKLTDTIGAKKSRLRVEAGRATPRPLRQAVK